MAFHCDHVCLSSLASAVCLLLASQEAEQMPINFGQTIVVGAATSLLRARASTLAHEFNCGREGGALPLRGKAVENGKSAMSFLVPGGSDPDDGSTYSVLFKQLNKAEAALLPSLFPALQKQYARSGGSLLAPILGWLRYTPPSTVGGGSSGGSHLHQSQPQPRPQPQQQRPFEIMLMDNVARPPPGTRAMAAGPWKPFDMKGIRLYAHEQRFDAAFGRGGLRIGASKFDALRASLTSDVLLLREWGIVDFSYLLSAFPLAGATPAPCNLMRGHADYHERKQLREHGPRRLISAMYQLPVEHRGADDDVQDGSSGAPLCLPVAVRLGIIDYLREFRMGEYLEHVQKSIQRDLFAGERNHAVVPVRQFGERFGAFFGAVLFTPLPPQPLCSSWARQLHLAARDASEAVLAQMRLLAAPGSLAELSLRRWAQLAQSLAERISRLSTARKSAVART